MAVLLGGKRVGVGAVTGIQVPYNLPPATTEVLGGVIVGEGLKVDAFGLLEANPALDSEPTKDSTNLVTSGVVADALEKKAESEHTHGDYLDRQLDVEKEVLPDSEKVVTSKAVFTAVDEKSDRGHMHEGMVFSEHVQNMIISEFAPTDEDGVDGDLWFVYKH